MYGLWKTGGGTGNYASTNKTVKESDITNKAIKLIKATYPSAVVIKIHGGTYQRAGIPDLYIAVSGVSIWIEMKRPGADTTALQKQLLDKLKSIGVPCGIAESPDRVIEIIEKALAG